jgi:Chaperone of endosialidase
MLQALTSSRFRIAILAVSLLLASTAFAGDPVGHMSASASGVSWAPSIDHDRIVLTITAPDGTTYAREFASGNAPSFRPQDLPGKGKVQDGVYTYELRVVARISSDVKRSLAAARQAGDDAAVGAILHANGLDRQTTQSGVITVVNGSIINSDAPEPGAASLMRTGSNSAGGASTGSEIYHGRVTPLNQVVADNEIVQGSLCVGLDCSSTETFGFETIKLKENNTRILFDDTSTSAGFPNNDWQLVANDSASGGANKFSLQDVTNSKFPVEVMATAPTDSIFVATSGKIGLGNANPGLNIHITATDTPAIRQEQTNGGGFTAQTWDIGANEANWFVRDLTGGSRLPFRIRPGAPTSTVDLQADGDVGVDTASPNANTRVDVTDTTQLKARIALTGQEYLVASNTSTDGVALLLGVNRTGDRQLWIADTANIATQSSSNKAIRIAADQGDISARTTAGGTANLTLNNSGGNLGIGVSSPTQPIQHSTGAYLSSGGVWTNASSRTFKDEIQDLPLDKAEEALKALNPVTYVYKKAPDEHHVGFIAEDVPALVATNDRKSLSPMDIVAVLTKVVQEQQKTIDALTAKVNALEQQQPKQ